MRYSPPEGAVVSPNGTMLAYVNFDHSVLDLLDLETGSRRRLLSLGGWEVAAVGWLPNNREIVFDGIEWQDHVSPLSIIDMRTGDVRELAAGAYPPEFAVGHDSGLIGYESATFRVITPEGTEVASFPLPSPTRPGAIAGVEAFYLR